MKRLKKRARIHQPSPPVKNPIPPQPAPIPSQGVGRFFGLLLAADILLGLGTGYWEAHKKPVSESLGKRAYLPSKNCVIEKIPYKISEIKRMP